MWKCLFPHLFFVTKICYALTYRGGIPLILCNFVFSKNFYKNMLVLKVRIDLFFVVFGAVALEVLLYAVLISYICERFGMSKNEYTNKIYYS